MSPLFAGSRPRRHSTMSISCLSPVSTSPSPSPLPGQQSRDSGFQRKHLRRLSSVGNIIGKKKDMETSPTSDSGDLSISYPWNFQHKVHVDEHLNGLPQTWSALLEEDEKQPMKPEVVMAKPVEMKDGSEGDISAPWGTKHNIHIDEHLNGLPPSWAILLAQSGKEQAITSSNKARVGVSGTAGDPSISMPWNFAHNVHSWTGQDGLPRGLPPAFVERLAEVGYTPAEVESITA